MSNLGSSLGTAIAGTILVASPGNSAEAAALLTLAVIGLVGFAAATLLPRHVGPGVEPGVGATAIS